jgi:uncharacterized membrane protein YbhN (UPF0104 family)
MDADNAHPEAPDVSSPVAATPVHRAGRFSRRSIGRWVALGLSLLIAALSFFVLARTFSQINPNELREAIAATSAEQIAGAALLTFLSFLALTGYDGLALRQLKLHVPYRITALASFTSYAISFTLGFPLITAGTVRYWIYSRRGLSPGKVASLTVISGVTFWLGMALVIAVGLTFDSVAVARIDHLERQINMMLGIGMLAALLCYLVWVSIGHRTVRVQGFKLELPGFALTVGQMLLGVVDLCSAAGVLYVLLPHHPGLDYLTFLSIYVFACVLGIASNAPGGIGVFEATMLKTVSAPSEAALLASLLLFRVIYYLVPFVLALAALGAHESVLHWRSLRDAMRRSAEERENEDTSV